MRHVVRAINKPTLLGPVLALLIFIPCVSFLQAEAITVFKVGTLLNGDGTMIKDAVIVIEKGKVIYVGKDYPVKESMPVFDFTESVATPGFIAANACLKVSRQAQETIQRYRLDREAVIKKSLSLNEERSESTPEMNLLHSIDPRAEDFGKAWRSGVTCVYLAPGNLNVYNGTGTILKTAGQSLEQRIVKNHVHLRVTLGAEPAYGNSRSSRDLPDLRTRRPQNRMGVNFIFRHELFNLQNKSREPDSKLSPQELLFRNVLKGELPLRIRAKSYLDIKAAFRIMDELGYRWILEDGVDASLFLEDLKSKDVPVIYGPVYKIKQRPDFQTDKDTYSARTPVLLAEKGILFSFQNNEYTAISDLRDDAIYAVEIGMARDQALKALTLNPARILGIADRLGTIEKGKDADILIFSGHPFDPCSRLERVVIDGLLLDPNK